MTARRDVWWRRCRVTRVVDGDTLDVVIDLGYHLTAKQRLRLLWVDTPELRGAEREAGLEARDAAISWALAAQGGQASKADRHHRVSLSEVEGFPLDLRTEKSDVFGRYLAEIHNRDGESLAATLIETEQGMRR